MSRAAAIVVGMTITDEDCLSEALAFNEQFEAAAATRPACGQAPSAAALALLRRNRLGGDAPPNGSKWRQDITRLRNILDPPVPPQEEALFDI